MTSKIASQHLCGSRCLCASLRSPPLQLFRDASSRLSEVLVSRTKIRAPIRLSTVTSTLIRPRRLQKREAMCHLPSICASPFRTRHTLKRYPYPFPHTQDMNGWDILCSHAPQILKIISHACILSHQWILKCPQPSSLSELRVCTHRNCTSACAQYSLPTPLSKGHSCPLATCLPLPLRSLHTATSRGIPLNVISLHTWALCSVVTYQLISILISFFRVWFLSSQNRFHCIEFFVRLLIFISQEHIVKRSYDHLSLCSSCKAHANKHQKIPEECVCVRLETGERSSDKYQGAR